MQSQRFSRSRRLRRRSEFQHAFTTATRVHGRFLTLLTTPNKAGEPRLGIVASRKVGDAVRRNRAKRLIREVFRRNVPASSGGSIDIVVIPRREFFDASYASLEQDFRSALKRSASRRPSHAG
jgi:ribonuclease P protein component